MREPSTEVYHGKTIGNLVSIYFNAVRPAFLSASVLPVVTALAYVQGNFGMLDYSLAMLVLTSIVFIHCAANVLNDYFDAKNGSDAGNQDRIYPFSGGSRFIQNKVLSERQMLVFGIILFLLGCLIGLVIAFMTGQFIFWTGLTGAILAVTYSMPTGLASKGFGDLVIALCFGLLPVMGTVYTQVNAITADSILTGLVISCFVVAILWINSIPDREADKKAGKNTWPSRLSEKVALRVHIVWFVLGFSLVLFTPLLERGYLALLAVIPATVVIVSVIKQRLMPAIPLTLLTHALVCVLLAVGFLTNNIVMYFSEV